MRMGKDAFHRVPFSGSVEVGPLSKWDGVESVPTNFLGEFGNPIQWPTCQRQDEIHSRRHSASLPRNSFWKTLHLNQLQTNVSGWYFRLFSFSFFLNQGTRESA